MKIKYEKLQTVSFIQTFKNAINNGGHIIWSFSWQPIMFIKEPVRICYA